jgi:hypothetical protein
MALKNLLIDGSLTTDLTIEQGKEGAHVVPLLFLARGIYGFRAIVQETSGGSVVGTGLVSFLLYWKSRSIRLDQGVNL